MEIEDRILYEDNHLIVVNKLCGELSQGDETGDETLADRVKAYLKEKYAKPGNVYLGIPHRLDRPTSGVMVYARTEKALVRLNAAFRTDDVHKTYWAIVDRKPEPESATLRHFITRDSVANKSVAHCREVKGSKEARLKYTLLASSERYHLLEIELYTGRHHQIRAQLKDSIKELRRLIATGAPADSVITDFSTWLDDKAREMSPLYKAIYVDVLKKMIPVVKNETGKDEDVPDSAVDAYAGSYADGMSRRVSGTMAREASTSIGTDHFDDDMDRLEQDATETRVKLDNLCEKIGGLTKALYGVCGLLATTIVGILAYGIQQILF